MNQEVLEDLYPEEIYKPTNKTVVIIPHSWDELSETSVQLLTKILSAVKLSPSSVRIVTLTNLYDPSRLPEVPANIILFGVSTNPPMNLYQPLKLMGIPIVVADALDSLDDSKKKDLWSALKAMFGA